MARALNALAATVQMLLAADAAAGLDRDSIRARLDSVEADLVIVVDDLVIIIDWLDAGALPPPPIPSDRAREIVARLRRGAG